MQRLPSRGDESGALRWQCPAVEYNARREQRAEHKPMNALHEVPVECPYCGEVSTLLVDGSVAEQQYVEDCAVCCQPMAIRAQVLDDGRCRVEARREDDW